MKSKELFIKAVIIFAAMSTTAYLLMLGWFNTLSLDDYSCAVDINNYSPLEWMKLEYMTWQGRFSAFFVSGCVFHIWGQSVSLFSWTVIHLLLGYGVLYLYTRDVLHIKDVTNRIGITILVTNIAIMSIFEISTFYWLCCAGYFLVIYATLLLFYVIYVAKWKEWVKAIIAILCALYISGSAENYTPLVLMVLGLLWLRDVIRDAKLSSFNDAFSKHWLAFTVCAILGIGFIAMVAAPGNRVRMQNGDKIVGFMHDFRLGLFVKKTIIANVIFALRLISRGLYWVGLLPIFMYIGKMMHGNRMSIASDKVWKRILIATILLVGFIFIAVTTCVYGIGYYPPLRSMSFISYAVVAYLCYMGCLIGHQIAEKKSKWVTILAVCCFTGWSGFAGYEFVKEYPEVKRYNDFISTRNALIQQEAERGRTELLYVDAYEAPNWKNTYSYLRTTINKCFGSNKVVDEIYFPYMISNLDKHNPDDFMNKGLQDYYKINFKILER